jgi:hypothetical protein
MELKELKSRGWEVTILLPSKTSLGTAHIEGVWVSTKDQRQPLGAEIRPRFASRPAEEIGYLTKRDTGVGVSRCGTTLVGEAVFESKKC